LLKVRKAFRVDELKSRSLRTDSGGLVTRLRLAASPYQARALSDQQQFHCQYRTGNARYPSDRHVKT